MRNNRNRELRNNHTSFFEMPENLKLVNVKKFCNSLIFTLREGVGETIFEFPFTLGIHMIILICLASGS